MPKIVTSLNKLRYSGRMCPESWELLLTGLSKIRADDDPLDALQCLSICGPSDTLWQMPTHPEHSQSYRHLAAALARLVVHLADDSEAAQILDSLDHHLAGRMALGDALLSAPAHLRTLVDYDHHAWEFFEVGEAATGAVLMAFHRDPCLSPFLVAEAAAHALGGPETAQARISEVIRDFLSADDPHMPHAHPATLLSQRPEVTTCHE